MYAVAMASCGHLPLGRSVGRTTVLTFARSDFISTYTVAHNEIRVRSMHAGVELVDLPVRLPDGVSYPEWIMSEIASMERDGWRLTKIAEDIQAPAPHLASIRIDTQQGTPTDPYKQLRAEFSAALLVVWPSLSADADYLSALANMAADVVIPELGR